MLFMFPVAVFHAWNEPIETQVWCVDWGVSGEYEHIVQEALFAVSDGNHWLSFHKRNSLPRMCSRRTEKPWEPIDADQQHPLTGHFLRLTQK